MALGQNQVSASIHARPFRRRGNAIAERVVRTIRNECLDHVFVATRHSARVAPELCSTTKERRIARLVGVATSSPPRRACWPSARSPVYLSSTTYEVPLTASGLTPTARSRQHQLAACAAARHRARRGAGPVRKP